MNGDFMNKMRTLIFSLSALTLSSNAFADNITDANSIEERDIQAMREWVNVKRQVTVKEIGGALSISGEVRGEFQCTKEKQNGVSVRGKGADESNSNKKAPSNAFDVEVNLMLDYRTDRTWAAVKLEFDNNAGIFGGSNNKINLERAIFGARLVKTDDYTVDVELGRKSLGSIFDSKLQFASTLDGVVLKYDRAYEKIGDFYVHGGAFVIDERRDCYGYAAETGFLNIKGTGFYSKYSLVTWDTAKQQDKKKSMFDFVISQGIVGYRCKPEKLDKVVVAYAGGLMNHAAKKVSQTGHKRKNLGGYVGCSVGQLRKKGDWAADLNFQLLQAQGVADFDVSGIRIGNVNKVGLYNKKLNGDGDTTTQDDAIGNGNFKGVSLKFDYLATNSLAVTQSFVVSNRLDNLGPSRKFRQYELEFVYSF